MCCCFQLHPHIKPQRNLSYTKINLVFGANHVTRIPIYFTLLTVFLSLSHALTQPPTFLALQSLRQFDRNTVKNEKHSASKNTFMVQMKLEHLPSFYILNFPWMSMLSHTYRHTHIQPTRRCILCYYILFSSQAYIHTHMSTTMNFSLLLS